MLLYLKKDFDESVLKGDWEQGIKLYVVSEDERQELFLTEITDLFARIKQVQISACDDITTLLETLTNIQDSLPEKKVVNLAGKKDHCINRKTDESENANRLCVLHLLLWDFCFAAFVQHIL